MDEFDAASARRDHLLFVEQCGHTVEHDLQPGLELVAVVVARLKDVSLTLGVPLDLLGALDISAGAGLLLVVPGGLFELVFLPIWLFAKGFRTPPSTEALSSPAVVTSG